MDALPDILAATAADRGMFARGAPVLAMVSGGADSVALLRALAAGAAGPLALSVLHVDHLLRGEDSAGDAAFVASLCEELGVPCRMAAFDVAAYAAEEGLNLEDAGRRVRYRFADETLDALCAEAGVVPSRGRIATAHTLDDRAETIVMRLAQGAGAGGLLSPPYVRGRIVRPLLDCTRSQVVAYLEGLGQQWREDATNADVSRTRARVRAEVVPLLRDINPRFDEALLRTVSVLGDEDALLDEMASAFARDFAEVDGGELRFERARVATLSRAMRRRVVRTALFAAFPEASRIEFEHLEAVVDAMTAPRFARDLGAGLRAFTEYGTLVISRGGDSRKSLAPSLLSVPGTVDFDGVGSLSATPAPPDEIGSDPFAVLIDAGSVRGELTVGPALPGDRMRPLGMEGSRKLQDILTDAKVPRRSRPFVPVVRDGERVVWVAGVGMSDDYRVGDSTTEAVRLRWSRPSEVRRDPA